MPPRACILYGPKCSDGGIAVPGKSRCKAHGGGAWQRVDPASKHRYGSDWQLRRARVLKEEPLCRVCRRPATDVDHIRAHADGGTDDRENLRALCKPCHKKHTAEQNRARRKRQREAREMTTTAYGGLPCAHHGCNRLVAPEDGYCPEHKPPSPRVLMTGNFQPRNLDNELREAQIRHARARAALDAAEKHLLGCMAQALGMVLGLMGSASQVDLAGVGYLIFFLTAATGWGVLAVAYSKRHALGWGPAVLGVLGAPIVLGLVLVAMPTLLAALGLMPTS